MAEKIFARALVIRGGALGDFLLTLPVLQALREAAETLEILAYPQFAALARAARLADGVRSIEYGPLAGFFARGAVQDPELRAYFASFDVVLSYLFDPDGIFAENLRASGVEKLVTGPHRPDESRHAIEQLAAPLDAMGVGRFAHAAYLGLTAPQAGAALMAIHPGSGSAAKNWPPANWKSLAEQMLAADPQLRVAIIGGEADRAALEPLQELRHHGRTEFWEDLPLTVLAGRLAGARAYLGHDTGVSHLAAVLDVPSLLLFGPTDPAVWAPPHPQVSILRAPNGDLAGLGVASVLAAARKHLAPRLLASAADRPQNPPR